MRTNSPTFDQTLKWGQTGETAIACWLRRKGWDVLPVYEKVIDTGKGPRVFTAYHSGQSQLVAPDMLAFRGDRIQWVEGKRKTRFTWRWTKSVWQDGIDVRHYENYLQLRERSPFPLWILFLHEQNRPSEQDLQRGCPLRCPTGLYGNEISYLKAVESHKDAFPKNGRSYPMVYWNIEHLKLLATLEDVLASQEVAA